MRLVKTLFEAYHELEKDILSTSVHREPAIDVGLNVLEVGEWLSASLGGEN